VTSPVAVFEAATWVKAMRMTKSYALTRENMEIEEILRKSPSKRSFRLHY